MPREWTLYEYQRPPHVLCVFRQRGGEVWVDNPKYFAPEFNVAYLEWKLTGIGREYLESLDPQARAQMEPMPILFGALLGGGMDCQIVHVRKG